MRLHVPALPHTELTRAFDWCAYTAKVRRLPRMLAPYGHQVVLYGAAGRDHSTHLACEEYVPLIGNRERERWFGAEHWPTARVFDRWDAADPCWAEWNQIAERAIRARLEPGDALGLIAGWCQNALSVAFPDLLVLEWGVGYEGVLPQSLRAYESRAWQAYLAGRARSDDVRYFDAVIPNAYGADELAGPCAADDYLLFLGRPTERKGLAVVRELAARFPVVTAGQSDPEIPGARHVGLVTGIEKASLIARARAVLAPTVYLEPFGGVAVEAQLCGAPAITTDWGAFPETVEDGVSGYRCATLGDFCRAADDAGGLNREHIAQRARARWTLEAVAPLYDRWLRRASLLAGEGWYTVGR